MDPDDLEALRHAAAHRGEVVEVVVTDCAYSCCGKGWRRRDGYEQTYRGYVDNFQEPEGEAAGTFMLYAAGIGTLSYVVAVRFPEVVAVSPMAS